MNLEGQASAPVKRTAVGLFADILSNMIAFLASLRSGSAFGDMKRVTGLSTHAKLLFFGTSETF